MPDNIEEVIAPLRETLQSGWIGEGPKVVQFENSIATFLKTRHVTALNSCTSALQLALRLSGVGSGDEVITTPMTCVATNEPIILTGATPVWADIDPETGNIDPASIREKISARTRVIVVVHWGGYPADLVEINKIAKEFDLKVIEDCAHAWGSKYQGEMIGSHSDYCCFSLQAIKHFTTGDGGILVCHSKKDHERARSLKWFGIDRIQRVDNQLGIAEWDVVEAGYKYHMNDIAAVIGLAQLPYLPELVAKRQANAAYFKQHLSRLDRVQLLKEENECSSSYWLFTIKVQDRVNFIHHLMTREICSSIVHARNDSHSLFSNYHSENLGGLDEFSDSMVCIPVGHWLTEHDREKIVKTIRRQNW